MNTSKLSNAISIALNNAENMRDVLTEMENNIVLADDGWMTKICKSLTSFGSMVMGLFSANIAWGAAVKAVLAANPLLKGAALITATLKHIGALIGFPTMFGGVGALVGLGIVVAGAGLVGAKLFWNALDKAGKESVERSIGYAKKKLVSAICILNDMEEYDISGNKQVNRLVARVEDLEAFLHNDEDIQRHKNVSLAEKSSSKLVTSCLEIQKIYKEEINV